MGINPIGRTAFDVIYDTHAAAVYKTAYYYCGNVDCAEEITQDVFVKLYTYMEHINMDAIGKWLIVTTKNMALNHIRKRKREVLFADIYEEEFKEYTSEGTEDEFIRKYKQKEYRELADNIFGQLFLVNERWYEAVTMTYCFQKSQREVAEIMGISIQTLYSILHRAKVWIKKNYGEKYEFANKA